MATKPANVGFRVVKETSRDARTGKVKGSATKETSGGNKLVVNDLSAHRRFVANTFATFADESVKVKK